MNAEIVNEYPENDKNLVAIMKNCFGTMNYYCSHYLSFKYTDGVKTFCDKASAYWLLDIIESVVKTSKEMTEDLISVVLTVFDNNVAIITFKNSEKTFYEQKIPYTDCPMGEWKFFYQDNVFFWNAEY